MNAQQTHICILKDKLSIGTSDSLRTLLDPVFHDPGIKRIVFDMVQLSGCDSYGLKLLLYFHRLAESTAKDLILYRPEQAIREVLSMTKLDRVFDIRTDIDEDDG